MGKRWTRWLWISLAASPAIVPLILIYLFGVNFHFLDEWNPCMAGLFVKAHQHQFTLADLFAQNNEHRDVIPRLLLLATNPITHWNNYAVLVMEWAIVLATSLIILNFMRRTLDPHPGAALSQRTLVLWFIANLLIFTPLQYENWLWGIGLVNVMPSFFIFLSFLALLSRADFRLKFLVCLLLALAATYSLGSGVLAWPLIAILAASPSSNIPSHTRKWLLGAWIAAAALGIGFYFYHYVRPPLPASGVDSYSLSPSALLQYNLAYLGAAFSSNANTDSNVLTCTLLGSAMLAMLIGAAVYFVAAWRRKEQSLCDRLALWLTIALFGILSGAMASVFRAGYGPQQALSSRYITFAVYIPIALLNIIPIIAEDLRARYPQQFAGIWTQIPGSLAGCMLVLYFLTYPGAIHSCSYTRFVRRQGKATLLMVNVLPDNPLIADTVGNPADVKADAPVLNEMGYLDPPLISANDAAQLIARDIGAEAPIYGSLDGSYPRDNLIHLVGWAFNRRMGRVADGVFLTYESPEKRQVIFAAARMNYDRKDVAAHFDNPDYEWAGWEAQISPSLLPAGFKTITIRAWALDADTARAYPLANGCILRR